MKKTIVGILSFVFLFIGAQGVFASGPFNGQSGDCNPGIGIGVYPGNIQKDSYGCWSNTSITANAGDTINVAMYYHNNTGSTLTNVSGSIVKSSSGPSTSYTFTGRMNSSQGSTTIGTVTLNLTSSQTLTYSSTHWMKDANAIKSDTDTQIFNNDGGQISIGSVPAGWNDYGEFLAVFKVSNTTAPLVCQDSGATNYLGTLPCTYPAQLCKDTNANNINGPLPCTYAPQYLTYTITATAGTGGSISPAGITSYTYPNNSKFYTITPSNGYHALDVLVDGVSVGPSYGGYPFYNISTNHTIHATFAPDQVITKSCIATLSASRTTITAGESSLLSWTLADCTNASLYPIVGLIYSSGSQNVYPTSSMLYTLTATGANGTVTKTVMINVNAPTQYCQDYNANNYGKVSPCTYPPKLCIATLSASRTTITAGESSLLSWTLADCTNASLYPIVGLIYSSGSQNVYPTSSMLYTLTATGANGTVTKTVMINVNAPTQYCQDSKANNIGSPLPCTYPQVCQDSKANNIGSPLPCTYPQVCQDYNANNYGITGVCTYTKVENTILVTNNGNSVNNSVNNSNNNNSVNNSNNTTNTTNTTTNTTQIPAQQICQDRSANNYLSSGSCTYYNYNNNQTRCLDTSASNYLSYSNCIYNQIRCLDTSASNYLAYSSCIYNQVRCLDTTASNYLAYNACVYNTYVNKNVVTTVATNITRNEAQINGYITNTTYYNANVYFNYGTTVNLGSRTPSKTASGNSNLSDFLTGLNPNTIYFFQAVGESNTGISKGSIEVFKTLGNAVVNNPIIVQGTTIIGKASPVLLNISNKYQLIGAGDTVDYIVTYKNIGNTRLVRPMVQVVIPMNMTLINSSRGTYSVDTHTLSAPVEDLEPGQEGVIYLQARVDSIPLNNSQIVTTALLVYTNTNGAQENAMAYVFNEPSAGNGIVAGDASVLGASAFFGGFLSIGLIGWLLILLLVLIVILISRSYSKNNTSSESKTVTHTTTLQ